MVTSQEWDRDKSRFVRQANDGQSTAADPAAHDGVPLGPLAAQFAELTRVLTAEKTMAGVLGRIVATAHEVVPAADLVSVTLRDEDGTFHTPVGTDPLAAALDQVQYRTRQGPCFDAARKPGPAVSYSGDLVADRQWPRFSPAAVADGVHSVLATAVLPDAEPPKLAGALNMFARRPDSFTDQDRDVALLLASYASVALGTTSALTAVELEATQLREALRTRDVIGQAKGILMQRRGIDADEAFDLLRQASQNLNVKLADLARVLSSDLTIDLPQATP